MTLSLLAAILTITSALAFYSLGVFGERHSGILLRRHVILFWCGFLCDTTGTSIMALMAQPTGDVTLGLHAVSGVIAIGLMLFHAAWATIVLFRGNERQRANFHRLSIIVWLFWLIPYICGMLVGMSMNILDTPTIATISILVPVAMAWGFHVKAHRAHHMTR